jgi:hypothetical protein
VGCVLGHAACIKGYRKLRASVVFRAVPARPSNCTRLEVRYIVGKERSIYFEN